MIVVCSSCQARFKVADDKVGPRGAKVRCSKCQTVFVVYREPEADLAAPAPASSPAGGGFDLDLEAGPRPGFRPGGFAADPFGRSASAPAVTDPFAPTASSAAPDPFAAAASSGPPSPSDAFADDPFAAAPSAGASPTLGAIDPFVATVAAPGGAGSAVTDLSDLLGGGTSAAGPVEPSGLEASAAAPEPSGILDTGFDFAPDDATGMALDDGSAPPPAAAHEAEPGLALAERTPARPLPAAPVPGFGDFSVGDPFAGQGEESLELGGPTGFGDEEPAFEAPPAPPPPPRPPEVERREAAPVPPAAAAPAEAASPEASVDVRRRGSRIRSIVVNAISLVALLALAVAFLAYWRGTGPGAGTLLRPAAVLGGTAAATPFAATKVRSGLYDRVDAPPVLFVTGTAVSHAIAPVPGLRVRVEVVRKDAVVARGEARAGAVPTPEELHASRDAAGLAEAVARRLRGKGRPVKPGDGVPFLVAISDYPADVAGAGLRVTVEPVEAGAGAGAP